MALWQERLRVIVWPSPRKMTGLEVCLHRMLAHWREDCLPAAPSELQILYGRVQQPDRRPIGDRRSAAEFKILDSIHNHIFPEQIAQNIRGCLPALAFVEQGHGLRAQQHGLLSLETRHKKEKPVGNIELDALPVVVVCM